MALPMEMIAQSLLSLAQANAPKIASVTGKSPAQVKSALSQGAKILPNIFQNGTTPQGGAKILSGMGMDKNFIQQQFSKYSKYISKVPGMSMETGRSMVDALTGAMPDGQQVQSAAPATTPRFDRAKYPKI